MVELSHPMFGTVGHGQLNIDQNKSPKAVNNLNVPTETEEPQSISQNDLRLLIECGKVTDTIDIDGKKFKMSTLSDDVQGSIFKKFTANMSDAGSFMELRRTVVAMALDAFNGRPLEDIFQYGANDVEMLDIFGMRLALVRQMQGQVIDRLYGFYEELLKRSRQRVDPEQVKN